MIKNEHPLTNKDFERAKKILKPYLVPTGIKAVMQQYEVLILAHRSSSPLKHGLTLPHGIGDFDAEVVKHPDNEGEIVILLLNFFPRDVMIQKGDRIGLGIFMPFSLADGDTGGLATRTSGFGDSELVQILKG